MYKSLLRSRKNARKRGGEADMPYAEGDEQTYAIVRTMLGNGRVSALCNDGVDRVGRICGAMRRTRRAVVEKGDVVLCCFRDFDESVVDVVHRYSSDDVRVLMRNGVLAQDVLRELGCEASGDNDGGVTFQGDVSTPDGLDFI